MHTYEIFSDKLKVVISSKGAEVKGLFVTGMDHNWIWKAKDPWQRSAPVLFPIVGKLKNDSFVHRDQTYNIFQHGFARDFDFVAEVIAENKTRFILVGNEKTRQYYPHDFLLTIIYEVFDSKIFISYQVENLSNETIYFNLGWHPGFVLPHQNCSNLKITSPKGFRRYSLLEKGLLKQKAYSDFNGVQELEIGHQSFSRDAWIFLNSELNEVNFQNEFNERISIRSNAPHWGIWSSAPNKFVCIEPWWGYADLENASGILREKSGIQALDAANTWQCQVEVELFVSK